MAIPKEPRQLMINIMYLVLTALLALNVSAEIFNAFKMVNHGLEESNSSLDKSNADLPQLIKDGSKKKKEYEKWGELASQPAQIADEFSEYIENIVNDLIDKTGDNNGSVGDGDYVIKGNKKKLKGVKNKDVTTRMLVNEGLGGEIREKILETREKFLALIDEEDKAGIINKLTLDIDNESWQAAKKTSWEEFTFKQMPLGATQPIFTKFINDAKSSENAVLNYMLEKVGTDKTVVLDKFTVSSAPKKSYVIKGEPFETDVFMSASASAESNTDISISVNGKGLTVDKDGVAKYRAVPATVGIKKYTAVVNMKNPVTDEIQTFKKEFEYEVGERSCNVSAEKMNVFYIGVDNPVAVSAAGVPSAQLKVSASGSGINMSKVGGSKYNVTVSKPGESTITVSGGGLQSTNFKFRVKRIPDPVAKLSKYKGGPIASGIFKAQAGVIPTLEGFDFDAKCKIMGFQLVRIAKRQDAEIALNRGNRFQGDAAGLVSKAKPGDRYFFEGVKAKCPGDAAGRPINDMVFTIK